MPILRTVEAEDATGQPLSEPCTTVGEQQVVARHMHRDGCTNIFQVTVKTFLRGRITLTSESPYPPLSGPAK